MGARFIGSFRIIISRLTSLPILITVFHAVIGSSALLAGIFLAFDMVIKKTRHPMRTVFLIWIVALLLGIVTYIVRYIFTPLPPISGINTILARVSFNIHRTHGRFAEPI
jgi:uncharacterized membrane protein HdeD (DUF308 family)